MAKKIKLAQSTKDRIKKNFNPAKPPTRVNEKKYWNTINAGKIRYQTAFKEHGRFVVLPSYFTRLPFIQQIVKEKNTTVERYLSDPANLRTAKAVLEDEEIPTTFNPTSIEKALDNINSFYVYLNDGNGETRMTKEEMRLYISLQLKHIMKAKGYTVFFKGVFSDVFRKFVVHLEDFEGLQNWANYNEYISDDSITTVVGS